MTQKIVRTPTRAEGGLTPEEREKMKAHAALWTARAMRTEQIDPAKIVPAIKSLYAAAKLKEPRVVIVPSPRIMTLAGGFASAIWWLRKNPHSRFFGAATYAATDAATRDATRAATYAATRDATRDATDAATRDAKTEHQRLVSFFLACAERWRGPYQGGNMWASHDCYLSAFRDVLKLRLPIFVDYAAWEQCAIEGGFRWMHEEFCIVSDFPEILKVDEENRPHCDDGPSHRWRDGWELWYIHGVKVNRQIVMEPRSLTIAQVRQEDNAEVRRVMIERMGWDRFCVEAKLKVIHTDTLEASFPALPVSETVHADMRAVTRYRKGKEVAELLESEDFKDFDERPLKFVRVTDPSTGEKYTLRVWPDNKRAYEAIGQTFGLSEEEYKNSVQAHS